MNSLSRYEMERYVVRDIIINKEKLIGTVKTKKCFCFLFF